MNLIYLVLVISIYTNDFDFKIPRQDILFKFSTHMFSAVTWDVASYHSASMAARMLCTCAPTVVNRLLAGVVCRQLD